jgi:hypothetical protein
MATKTLLRFFQMLNFVVAPILGQYLPFEGRKSDPNRVAAAPTG